MAGAPTKYREDYHPAKLIEFFNRDLFQIVEGKVVPNYLPTVEKFCVQEKIAVSTFYLWAQAHSVFSEAFSTARSAQKDQIIQLGLLGHYKEGFAKFVAVNVTDMRDQRDMAVGTTEDVKRLVINFNE
jgi:hypothetical protein